MEYYELINKLGKLNLTPHESQALLCLIFKFQEEAKADEILKYASIPKSKIYDVLESLVKKGLIIKNETVYPYKYRRHPNLKESLDNLCELLIAEMKLKEEELRRVTNELIAQLIYGIYGSVTISTIKEATKNTIRMCMETQKGDEIMISTRTFDWLEEAKINGKSLFDILRKKISSKVKVRVLLANPKLLGDKMRKIAEENSEKLKGIGAEVGFYDQDMLRMTIAGNKCQFILWYYPLPGPSEESIKSDDAEAPCNIYYSENKLVVEEFKRLFNYHFLLWKIKEKSEVDKEFKELIERYTEIFGELLSEGL